jgi:hypothetical protein
MSERDPFGREQGEDPLAALGWRVPAEPETGSTAADAPAVEEPAVEPKPAPGSPLTAGTPLAAPTGGWAPVAPVRRRRRRSGMRVTLALLRLLLVGAVIAAILSVFVSVGGRIGGAIESPSLPTPVPPQGLDGSSLLRSSNLRKALAQMRGDGRVQSVKVSPASLEVRLVNSRHRVVWTVPATGDPQRISEPPYDDHNTTIRFAQIDPAAPSRLARASAARAQRDVRDVEGLVLLLQVGRPRWVLTFDGGLQFTADRHGRHVERG